MIKEYKNGNITWVDIKSPKQEDIREVAEKYKIDIKTANNLLSQNLKPLIDFYEDYTYLILHFPVSKHTHNHQDQEVNFLIGKDFLITTRYDEIDTFQKFSKSFEINADLEKNTEKNPFILFSNLIKEMYDSTKNEMDYSSSVLKKIENKIFEGKEKEMVKDISKTGRVLLDFKQTLYPHKEVLENLENKIKKDNHIEFEKQIKDIKNCYNKIIFNIEKNKEVLQELRETNNSLLSTKQNEVMKILTIMAFVTFPLSLIASIFGMNTVSTPIIGIQNDFWILIGAMALLMFLFFVFFKYRKWL